ncbi:hypothetical protein XELAEV_18030225mg [Xenopus laevis]|uniref:Uncharacterized protein n=1 Tax=Xenopus laevis TaxID=8355 RepID=A0A974HIB5_XENLA|nr:hypothetical protein XELAEV_18030225mg [Xenopus laevis]
MSHKHGYLSFKGLSDECLSLWPVTGISGQATVNLTTIHVYLWRREQKPSDWGRDNIRGLAPVNLPCYEGAPLLCRKPML